MNSAPHKGFTLVEVLLVVVIAGIIAAVAVPSVFRARDAAESAAAVAHLRTIHTNQALYRSQAGRYARLSELNAYSNNSLGKIEGSTLRHGDYFFLMYPSPTNEMLRTNYSIIAYRIRSNRVISHLRMSENGSIDIILP